MSKSKRERLSVAKQGLAALAAGAGLATGAQSEAAIVYTNIPDTPVTDGLTLDINLDTVNDIRFHVTGNTSPTYVEGLNAASIAAFLTFVGAEGPGVHSDLLFSRYDATPLPEGALIGTEGFKPHGHMLAPDGPDADWDLLPSGEERFLGVRLPGPHFGWVGITKGSLTVTDFAFDTEIHAGEGRPVPEPSSLILMAIGAAGVLAYRRARRE